jgi:predicted nucleotidyltransferase component of viral defense system
MRTFTVLPAEERALYWRNYSDRTGVPEFIVEKDFWVCWLLGHIFASPQLGAECVFKGGTSLSKVFGAIDRFSEDIDLGLSPASLGWKETDLDDAPSNSQRLKRNKQLQADCADSSRQVGLTTRRPFPAHFASLRPMPATRNSAATMQPWSPCFCRPHRILTRLSAR